MPVAIEVSNGGGLRIHTRQIRDCSTKGPVAISQKNAHTAFRYGIYNRQIRGSIAIEISRHQKPGATARCVVCGGPECSIAVSDQHTHGPGRFALPDIVRNSKIGFSISVEIRGDYRNQITAGVSNERSTGSERAITVSQQDADAFPKIIRGSQIDLAVSIKVSQGNGLGTRACAQRRTGS